MDELLTFLTDLGTSDRSSIFAPCSLGVRSSRTIRARPNMDAARNGYSYGHRFEPPPQEYLVKTRYRRRPNERSGDPEQRTYLDSLFHP